jgi:pyridoxal phosphate enzyme (YggS family)
MRQEELAANLAGVGQRIARACAAAGRPHDDVTLVAVTKTWPVSDAVLLRDLGVTDLAENRDQEAREKAAAVDHVRWHFVGTLQTNKARSVASYAHVVQSIDRAAVVTALSEGATRAGRSVEVLLQVSLDGDPGRGGALAEQLPALADQVASSVGLVLRGLMAVAPLGAEPAAAFGRLQELAADLVAVHPLAGLISAGMSGDLEAAIAAGATHVRVGTALLGHRPPALR